MTKPPPDLCPEHTKNAEEMTLTEECCRSGRSAQCNHPER